MKKFIQNLRAFFSFLVGAAQPTYVKDETIRVGSVVTWRSQSGGTHKKKTGIVVWHIPAFTDPHSAYSDFHAANLGPDYSLKFDLMAEPRSEDSFFVAINGARVTHLYHPRTKHLKFVE